MSDEEPDDTPTDSGEGLEATPEPEQAYPSLELDKLSESDHGGHDDWLPLGDEP
jgi:hypothetical protein